MPKKRYKPEEIVAKLRQVDVHLSQGSSVADAIPQIGVSEVTYYRWRQVSPLSGRVESWGGGHRDGESQLAGCLCKSGRLRDG